MDDADEQHADEQIEAALTELLRRAYPELRLVTNWVVVIEAADENGEQNITAKTKRGTPVWTSKGMLRYAADYLHPVSWEDEDE